jgi:DNA-binding transcriptional MerR regulator
MRNPAVSEEKKGILLRIGELANRCGKTVRALHLYEDLGLLQPTSRSKGRFRLYDPSAADRVRWIGKLQEMGFSLTEIQQFLRSWTQLKSAPSAMRQIREIFSERLKQTDDTIGRLSALKREMEESLSYLERCHQCTSEMSECERCAALEAPMLVAEFHRRNGRAPGEAGEPALPARH